MLKLIPEKVEHMLKLIIFQSAFLVKSIGITSIENYKLKFKFLKSAYY